MTPRRGIALGALLTVVGIAVAGAAPVVGTAHADRIATGQTVGGVTLLVGWACLAWAIHRFGRTESKSLRD